MGMGKKNGEQRGKKKGAIREREWGKETKVTQGPCQAEHREEYGLYFFF